MSLGTGAAIASAVGALFAAVIAVASAEFSRRQANSARRQADAAEEQVKQAEEQVAAAWEQVVEARRANEAAAAERARMAVRWTAKVEPAWESITVRNVGTDAAWGVQAQIGGTDEDWQRRWEGQGDDDYDVEEVRAGDYFPFNFDDELYPPRQIYVYWRGAPHPMAVEVEGSPP